MRHVLLNIRTTYKYNPGWVHLDEHFPLCTVRMTPPRTTWISDDYDEEQRAVSYVRRPALVNHDLFKRAIEDTLSGSNCQHEFDCCGCWSRRVSVTRYRRRTYRIVIYASQNY